MPKIIATKFKKPLKMSDEDEQHFQEASGCHICNQAYTNKDIRVRDHCHITGNYRGSAHPADCNLKLRINPKEFTIPFIFHNLRGYDSHFIMQEIRSIEKKHDLEINCIPNNMEKYMAFMLGKHYVFLDSNSWLLVRIDLLLIFLRMHSNIHFMYSKVTSWILRSRKVFILMIISDERLNDKQLPSKADFYSILTDEGISDDSYTHAQKVWNTFKIRTMGEYHDLYLKSDILLLADVFENF